MRKGVVGSISGAEDELDSRRLVVKGSGATYVVGSKIERWLATIDVNNITPDVALQLGLPRGRVSFHELFVAVGRAAKIFNNFPFSIVDPIQMLQRVAAEKRISVADLKNQVIETPPIPNRMIELRTPEDYQRSLDECLQLARTYEPFSEKLFEIWKKKNYFWATVIFYPLRWINLREIDEIYGTLSSARQE